MDQAMKPDRSVSDLGAEEEGYPWRGEEGRDKFLRRAADVACRMRYAYYGCQWLWQWVAGVMDLQNGLVFLISFAGCLLPGFVFRHFFIEITFAFAAGQRGGAVDAKVFGDKVPVDLVFKDQAPFAEGLGSGQQDQ